MSNETNYDDSMAYESRKKRLWPRFLTILLTVVAVVLFFFTEDLTLPMGWINQWTLWHIIIFLTVIFFAIVASRRKKSDEEDQQRYQQQPLQTHAA